ncbi:hypothetical protein [Cyclobacterium xiamenense]|jgi:hypothetical protein|uniref:hypothetical protein n=1 Tax=Cyclobacterium xiamenense TaxID=1297121 RepID=UPI0012B93171|nr:hypothetical protein [Cyclobacterium xiamenense]
MNGLDKRYCFLPFLIFTIGCEVLREDPSVITSTFLPLAVGNFWEYRVENTRYFGEDDFESETFFYRDQITDQTLNAENELVFWVRRQRSADRNIWDNEKAYTLTFSGGRVIRQDNNLLEIILVYPLHVESSWDGNTYNSLPAKFFFVESAGDLLVENTYFPETMTIRQSEEDDLITLRDNRYEVFAREVGLIESYYEVFRYCSRNDCLGQQIIQEGRFTHLKLIRHGKE